MKNYQIRIRAMFRSLGLVIVGVLFASQISASMVPESAKASTPSLSKNVNQLSKKIGSLEKQVSELQDEISYIQDSRSAFEALPIQFLTTSPMGCPKFSRWMGEVGKTADGSAINSCQSIFYIRQPFN